MGNGEKKGEKKQGQIFTDRSRPTFHVASFRAEKIENEPRSAALDTFAIKDTADVRLKPVECMRKDLRRALFAFETRPRTETSKQ